MISDFLPTGRENAIKGSDLCTMLNCDNRSMRAEIERERKAGKPICSSCGSNPGYYMAASQDEMRTFCRLLESQLRTIAQTHDACLAQVSSLPE